MYLEGLFYLLLAVFAIFNGTAEFLKVKRSQLRRRWAWLEWDLSDQVRFEALKDEKAYAGISIVALAGAAAVATYATLTGAMQPYGPLPVWLAGVWFLAYQLRNVPINFLLPKQRYFPFLRFIFGGIKMGPRED